jgi:hypothetical protein
LSTNYFTSRLFLKKQQWTITNYIALIYAAIFGVTKELQSTSFPSALKCILIAATIVACVYGLTALMKAQVDLGEARKRLDKVDREIFGDKEYREWRLELARHVLYWRTHAGFGYRGCNCRLLPDPSSHSLTDQLPVRQRLGGHRLAMPLPYAVLQLYNRRALAPTPRTARQG